MKKYRCLKSNTLTENGYSLVPIREQDIQFIRKWRNDQIDILRQEKKLTKDQQVLYFDTVIKPSFVQKHPRLILFSLLLNDLCIGYGGLVHIDWIAKRAEVSFLNNTERSKKSLEYNNDFSNFLDFILKIGFDYLNLNKLYTEAYDIRPQTIKILERKGFELEGRLRQHVSIKGKYVDSLIHGVLKRK
jgi:hypothetical protein